MAIVWQDMAVGLPAADNGDGKVAIINGAAGDWPVPDLGVALDEALTSFSGVTGAGPRSIYHPGRGCQWRQLCRLADW